MSGRSTTATADRQLREHVLYLLDGGGAHESFEELIEGLPSSLRGARPAGLPYTPWRLLEHLRIAQWDILEFTRNEDHVSPPWPDGYWPHDEAPPTAAAWDRSVKSFRADKQALRDIVADDAVDLLARIPHGEGQTILREALLAADHNAYHLGQLMAVRRLIGAMETDGQAPDNI